MSRVIRDTADDDFRMVLINLTSTYLNLCFINLNESHFPGQEPEALIRHRKKTRK